MKKRTPIVIALVTLVAASLACNLPGLSQLQQAATTAANPSASQDS
ncbi:hypothetical protein LARV_01980, partial [Longilinea arvoryzae]